MPGKLTRVPGTKGVARYSHTDRPMHDSAKSLIDGGAMKPLMGEAPMHIPFGTSGPKSPKSAPGL